MTGNQLNELLKDSDIQQIGQYMKQFDRMLLYTMAVNSMPRAAIDKTIDLWETVVKRNIDSDAKKRTMFLESTIEGRRAKYANEPDGEALRIHCLKQLDVAREVVSSNLSQPPEMNEED